MSKADSINKKIRKAYGKVGKTLGYPFEIYRPSTLDNQISTASFIDVQHAAFSVDEKFSKSVAADKLPVYTAYVNGLLENLFDMQKGDILYREETGETYIATNIETHKAIQVFQCNNRVTVSSPTSSVSGTFTWSDTEVATNLPCYIDVSTSGGQLGYMVAQSYGTDPKLMAKVYCSDPNSEFTVHSNIVDQQGRRWDVISVEDTSLGIILTCEEYVQ